VPTTVTDNVDKDAYRVLLTGFGVRCLDDLQLPFNPDNFSQPFAHYKENPSWLAVQPLHNKILAFDPPAAPIAVNGDVIMNGTDESEAHSKPCQIHITACMVPTTYEAVLSIVPSFHARPPVLPEFQDPQNPNFPPHEDGFDFCLHVGVAGRGPLRVERVGHKKGYNMKDATGKLAPIVPVSISTDEAGPAAGASDPTPPSEVQRVEMEQLGYDPFGRLENLLMAEIYLLAVLEKDMRHSMMKSTRISTH